jgi:hypothetical protein
MWASSIFGNREMTPPYRGLFINLAESERRRNAMLSNLSDAGIASWYTPFPAVNGAAEAARSSTKLAAGALGLWLTHENIVDEFGDGTEHLHIMEETLSWLTMQEICFESCKAQINILAIDLLTETFVPFTPDVYRRALKVSLRKGRLTLDLTHVTRPV